jgi:hypothetical protein
MATVAAGSLRNAGAQAVQGGGGIAGGGSVKTADGVVANLSVFGTTLSMDDETSRFFGSLILTDDNGFKLVAFEISNYGPVDGEDDARILEGFATVNDEGRYPFSLKMVAGGFPGSGADAIKLEVEANIDESGATPEATELVYSIDAPLETGDITILTFDFDV